MTEILIYGIVGDSWDGLDANTLVPLISEGDDDLDLRINSPGGYVMEGLAIFNAVVREKKKGRKVTCHIDGLAASMASVLAMAGDEVLMADNALMMIHNPWDCACGDANELRRAADKLDRIRDQLVGIYATRTGLTAEDLIPMLDAETWLTAAEALEQNFATSIDAAQTVSASNVKPFGFRKAPDSPLITAVAMARTPRTAPAAPQSRQENSMTEVVTPPAAGNQSADTITEADVQARADKAVTAERQRVSGIRALGSKHRLDGEFIDGLIADGTELAAAREKILDKLAEQGDAANVGHTSPARVTQDARDKWMIGARNSIIQRAGLRALFERDAATRGEKADLDPGEFASAKNADLARDALDRVGIKPKAMASEVFVPQALTARSAITQTTSDFPVLLEDLAHRTVQAAYNVAEVVWPTFCATGSLGDFKPNYIYQKGSVGTLDAYQEAEQIKYKPLPDGAREVMQLEKYANLFNLSIEAIINDDLGAFTSLATDIGEGAKYTVEKAVFALLAANPNTSDGNAFFSAAHGNLAGTGAAGSVNAWSAIRVAMARQKDISNNRFLAIRPSVLLLPTELEDGARVLNDSPYDPDATNKLQRPNVVGKMFERIVGTPELTGTAYYAFADPARNPAIMVSFYNGQTEPRVDSRDGWSVDGIEWRVRHWFDVGAINWRSAYKQPGA